MKMMNKFIVNGNEVNAYYSSNDINDVLIPLLKRWIHIYETKKKRVIVYLAACPGSGKSTLALFLEELYLIIKCFLYISNNWNGWISFL